MAPVCEDGGFFVIGIDCMAVRYMENILYICGGGNDYDGKL